MLLMHLSINVSCSHIWRAELCSSVSCDAVQVNPYSIIVVNFDTVNNEPNTTSVLVMLHAISNRVVSVFLKSDDVDRDAVVIRVQSSVALYIFGQPYTLVVAD